MAVKPITSNPTITLTNKAYNNYILTNIGVGEQNKNDTNDIIAGFPKLNYVINPTNSWIDVWIEPATEQYFNIVCNITANTTNKDRSVTISCGNIRMIIIKQTA